MRIISKKIPNKIAIQRSEKMSTLEAILKEIAIQLRIANTLKNKTGYYQDRAKAAEEVDRSIEFDSKE